jgi:drug/metabolite transporter (DMT)-like permease
MSAPYASTVITDNDPKAKGADRSPLLLAALGAACISASGILVKLADTGPATAAFYRCFLALPALGALALLERRRCGPRSLASHGGAAVAGLCLAVDLVLWNHAIAEVGAGIATVLGNLQVVFVTFIAWAVLRERPERRVLAVLPVVMGGVVLVSGLVGTSMAGIHPLAGIGYGVSTSIAYAVFLLIMRRASSGAIAGPLAEATAGAAVGSLVLGVAFGGLDLKVGWPSFGWLLLLSLTSQTIGWLLITSSLPRLPAAISALTLLLQPAAAMVLAAIVLAERPSLTHIAGAVVVCCGVVVVARSQNSPQAATGDSPARRWRAGRWRLPARRPEQGTPAADGRWSEG